jgi:hypothetical protein
MEDIFVKAFVEDLKRMASIRTAESTAQNVNAISKQNGCAVIVAVLT